MRRVLALGTLTLALMAGLVPAMASPASAAEISVRAVPKRALSSPSARISQSRLLRTAAVAPTTTPAKLTLSPTETYSQRLVTLMNAERTKRGLRPLAWAPCLDGFSDPWAAKLAATGPLSHQSLSPILTKCGGSLVGENVAYTRDTADSMHTMWMNSSGHRANILNPRYTHFGLGVSRASNGAWYGTTVFQAA